MVSSTVGPPTNIFGKMFQLGDTQVSNMTTDNTLGCLGQQKWALKSNKSNFLFFSKVQTLSPDRNISSFKNICRPPIFFIRLLDTINAGGVT